MYQLADLDRRLDEVTNDVTVQLALRHALVHNVGMVNRKYVRQVEESHPRTFRRRIELGEIINFHTDEIHPVGATMIKYVQHLAYESRTRIAQKYER